MAITLAATPDVQSLSGSFKSVTGDEAFKRTILDGGMIDADVEQLLQFMDDLSNAQMIGWKWGDRAASGFAGSASSSSQNLVSAFMVLNFAKVHPLNASETVQKSWVLPAYLDTLRDGANQPDVGTPGTGTIQEKLGTIVALLEDNLAYKAADGAYYNGGWTYQGGGFGTGNDVIDGE